MTLISSPKMQFCVTPIGKLFAASSRQPWKSYGLTSYIRPRSYMEWGIPALDDCKMGQYICDKSSLLGELRRKTQVFSRKLRVNSAFQGHGVKVAAQPIGGPPEHE